MSQTEDNQMDAFLQAFYSAQNSTSSPTAAPAPLPQKPQERSFSPQLLDPHLAAAIANIGDDRFRSIADALSQQLLHVATTPARSGEMVPIPTDLPIELQTALRRIGISALYSHQVEALEILRSGKDLSIATATASGKTLSFLPAILESCLIDPNTRALLLFPLKALAVDQMKKLRQLVGALPPTSQFKVGLLTGDTPMAERQRLFIPEPPRILGMNPDILHFKLYATCKSEEQPWREFLRQLRYVIVDEAHTYVGSFGSHFANLMRRLRVAVDSAGGNSDLLQFSFSTATVGNPVEMALRFSGREATPERLHLIDKSGAGNSGRTLLCLQPSWSANIDASNIAMELMQQGLSTLIFTPTRAVAKNLLNLIQRHLRQQLGYPTNAVAVFYGSLRSDRRHDIIEQLQRGKIKVVISTIALEAGIDLPEIDCVLVRGWPGSLMSFRQQIGRSGRVRTGLAIFLPVAQNALDSFYGSHPQLLLTAPAEQAICNPNYPVTLAQHLRCSCVEAGVPQSELAHYFGSTATEKVASSLRSTHKIWLNQHGLLRANGYPHKEISIRGGNMATIELVDKTSGEAFEEMDLSMAHREVHPGAIYLAQDADGEIAKYKSESLSVDSGQCILEPMDADSKLSTQANTDLEISLQTQLAEPMILPTSIEDGRVRLTHYWGQIHHSVTGYSLFSEEYERTCTNRECRNYHHYPIVGNKCSDCGGLIRLAEITKVIDEVAFEDSLVTRASAPVIKVEINGAISNAIKTYVAGLKEEVRANYETIPQQYQALWESHPTAIALHSIAHQIILATPLVVLASSLDLDFIIAREQNFMVGYFYETTDGGNGSSDNLFKEFGKFAAAAKSLAENCSCTGGCPRCLTIFRCPQQNRDLSKEVGLFLLAAIN